MSDWTEAATALVNCEARERRMRDAAPELLELLRGMCADLVSEHICVVCDRCFGSEHGQHDEHDPDCRALAALALLKRIDGE